MRKYFIPGCVGRGLDLDLRIRPVPAAPAPAASRNPSGWAQAGPKWVGPRRAQVGGPKLGPSGPKPEIWDPKKSKNQKFSKSKSVLPKMSARFFVCRKKASPPHLGPSRPIFCVGRKNPKIAQFLPIFLGGPMGPIHPVWGPCCYPPEVGQ